MSLYIIWITKKYPIITKKNISDLSESYSQETGIYSLVGLHLGTDLFYVKRILKAI